jgi:methoxymalonate biosynthesis acyl carrier protein
VSSARIDDQDVEAGVTEFLRARTAAVVEPDQELFASGLVTSMFAMELVVHLEQTYGVAIVGSDLRLDNFRTVRSMGELVRRLRETADA